ncbi:OsmC family protein [Pollutibacter soli]|uniref:OsmC family protein n=1 Tax=Pollutibacter soli TaxID=3034157 RepID=UPI003013437D
MRVSAKIHNKYNSHDVTVETNENQKTLQIASKPGGFGSAINGAELLMLSLATCYCNDIYREAAKRNLTINGVQVNCESVFGTDGEPASKITYQVTVDSDLEPSLVAELITQTDRMAEIHNTLRKGIEVTLAS